MEEQIVSVWPLVLAMMVQTVIIAAVNKSQIADLRESVKGSWGHAESAHRKVDRLKDRIMEYLRGCKGG